VSAEAVAVLEAFNEALAKGDPRLDLLDPEIVIVDHDIPDAGTYHGVQGFLKWAVEDWGSAWESWELREGEVLDAGDTVVSVFEMIARGKGSGVETRRTNATVNTVSNGRISRVEYYTTEDEARAAAGLTTSGTN
jgi:ketosteroid isomerase-like protein